MQFCSPEIHQGTKSTHGASGSMFLRFFKKISETTKSIVEDFAFVRDQYHNFPKDWRDESMSGNLSLKSWMVDISILVDNDDI